MKLFSLQRGMIYTLPSRGCFQEYAQVCKWNFLDCCIRSKSGCELTLLSVFNTICHCSGSCTCEQPRVPCRRRRCSRGDALDILLCALWQQLLYHARQDILVVDGPVQACPQCLCFPQQLLYLQRQQEVPNANISPAHKQKATT